MFLSERHAPAREVFQAGTGFNASSAQDQSAHSSRRDSATHYSPSELQALNAYLETLEPIEILDWAVDHLPTLYLITIFDLSGCAIASLLSKLSKRRNSSRPLVQLIFIDTLYQFPQTTQLAKRLIERYSLNLETFYPAGATTVAEFEMLLGPKLWETEPTVYNYLTKFEPTRRASEEIGFQALVQENLWTADLQGRNESRVPILEVDNTGIIKINPLSRWTWEKTWSYVKAESVPYNSLLDIGYRQINDFHSTKIPEHVIAKSMDQKDEDQWKKSGKNLRLLYQPSPKEFERSLLPVITTGQSNHRSKA